MKTHPEGVIDKQRVDRALRARWQTSRRRRADKTSKALAKRILPLDGRAGVAPESIRGRSTFRLRDTPAPSRTGFRFFTSLLGRLLHAGLLAGSSKSFRAF
jgi:hypothetical protein